MSTLRPLLEQARAATRALRCAPTEVRDRALDAIADALAEDQASILEANAEDLKQATDLSSALRDRLMLDPKRVGNMIRSVREVRALPDPLKNVRDIGRGRSGVQVTRRRIPLGVIAIIYEARPNVTAECASLTIKSGNVVVLRGGKEARHSNVAIANSVRRGLERSGLDPNAVVMVTDPTRETMKELLGAVGLVDLVIPRGGASLMSFVDEFARVPVIRHGQGICHLYVDKTADIEMAVDIAENAKVQRPGVCNAIETIIVHREVVEALAGALGPRLAEHAVEVRADEPSLMYWARSGVNAKPAEAKDFDTEFLDYVLAVRTVDDVNEALDHIERHGTHHTAAIVTRDREIAERFLGEVDASCVLWNASTRFNDGGELGLGAEMGISTSKMHAYGPMSVQELTTEKLVVYGDGQVRS